LSCTLLEKYRKQFLVQKRFFYGFFKTFFQKLGSDFSSFLMQWNYIKTYNCLYSLDSEKSKIYFFYHFFSRKCFFPGYTRSQNFGQKNRKMTIFKAIPRLVKIVIVQKWNWFTIFGPLSTRKCQNLGLYWFLWLWNIALKKRLLKTHVAFLCK
jgi:hypothetical protein